MLRPDGIDLNAHFRTPWTPQPFKKPGEKLPEPFANPDIYRPSNPHVPGPNPEYPNQPLWLPQVPSGPIIEVPNDRPVELPPFPGHQDWGKLPPAEMPDWSKMPKEFPYPEPFTIEIPNQSPNFPGKTFPDGTWLLS